MMNRNTTNGEFKSTVVVIYGVNPFELDLQFKPKQKALAKQANASVPAMS